MKNKIVYKIILCLLVISIFIPCIIIAKNTIATKRPIETSIPITYSSNQLLSKDGLSQLSVSIPIIISHITEETTSSTPPEDSTSEEHTESQEKSKATVSQGDKSQGNQDKKQTSGNTSQKKESSSKSTVSTKPNDVSTKTKTQIRKEDTIKAINSRGAYGKLYIDNIGIDVVLFKAAKNATLAEKQKIVDAKSSACFFLFANYDYYKNSCIVDHNYQGFDKLHCCKVGDIALIYTKTEIQKYKCIEVIPKGINNRYDLLKSDGTCVTYNKDYIGYMFIYTCNVNSGSQSIFLAIWEQI